MVRLKEFSRIIAGPKGSRYASGVNVKVKRVQRIDVPAGNGVAWAVLLYLTDMDMEAVMRQLRDTQAVLADVERRTAAGLKEQAEWLALQPRRLEEHERWRANHRRAMANFDDMLKVLREFMRRHQ